MNNVILGAGISGIGAFCADKTAKIYEQSSVIGGLCSSFSINGFSFDNAVHLSFTNDTFVRSIFDKAEYYCHKPESLSWYHQMWLKHPAQNNLYPLPNDEKVAAIKSFIERPQLDCVGNFAEWTKSQYGEWLYDNLFRPYNEKYWCIDLTELGVKWTGNRFYKPTIDEVLYGSYTPDTPNTYYAKEMRYPVKGGYISFVSSLIDEAKYKQNIVLDKKVVNIDPDNRMIRFLDGTTITYNNVFSSIPLPELCQMIDTLPLHLKEKSKALEHTGMVLVSIGFKKKIAFDTMWFYIYDKDIMAARAYMPSIKSENNVPKGCSSIQFEIYFNGKKTAPSKNDCVKNCLYALKKMKLADEADVQLIDCRIVPYGNIVFNLGTEEIADEITGWLREHEINPIGRFGEWKYYWSDQAFLSGYNAMKSVTEEIE